MNEPSKSTISEQIEVAGRDLIARIQELVAEGNVRRLILRSKDDVPLLEVPLTLGAVAGGAFVIGAPVLAAIGALAALIADVRIEIIRDDAGAPPEG